MNVYDGIKGNLEQQKSESRTVPFIFVGNHDKLAQEANSIMIFLWENHDTPLIPFVFFGNL